MLVKQNLRMIKRLAKSIPDTARAAIGVWTQKWQRSPWESDPVGKLETSPIRNYDSTIDGVQVKTVTPPNGHYMTTFFDVCPFSPSGNLIAVTRVPFINRVPVPGDKALVCVIDLRTGETKTVHETSGWGAQLGANVQWGSSDRTLFCNDAIAGTAQAVRIDLDSGHRTNLNGPVYGTDPERRYSYSADLRLINALIPGYGIPENPFDKYREPERCSSSNGLWRTDLETGACELVASIHDIVAQLGDQEKLCRGKYFLFNVKVDPTGTRLLLVIFIKEIPGRVGHALQLVTTDLDGKNAQLVVTDSAWRKGGHHPNWNADGSGILMNLKIDGKMRFVSISPSDGSIVLVGGDAKGSGHPTLHSSGKHILTDSYISEGFKDNHGNVPLRLIDAATGTERSICKIFTKNLDGPRRIDPHPAWDMNHQRIAFNGVVDGFRQVMIADLSKIV